MQNFTLKKFSAGFNLLEAMVALLIISIGFLGIATLQARGQQFNQTAYLRSQATFLATDLMDRMRINENMAKQGSYKKTPPSNAPDCESKPCSEFETVDYDLANWYERMKTTLPDGKTTITWQSPYYTITIQWASVVDNNQTREEQKWIFQP
jgi:type IV pilus assembly protein PilV